MRIVVGVPNLVWYPQGGGHWTWAIQYGLALEQAGCQVLYLLVGIESVNGRATDSEEAREFLERFRRYCPSAKVCLVLHARDQAASLDTSSFYGMTRAELEAAATTAGMLWNLAGVVSTPLLQLFRRRVLIDGDPGFFQVSALAVDLDLDSHDRFLTVGTNVGSPSCLVPLHGKSWTTFPQVLHLD